MNKTPLLTVILSTYNHVSTFERAIESVLSQKTNFEYKIIINDDASNDGTSDIVRKYAGMYPDKIIANIGEENTGATPRIIAAIEQLDTKYYAILETDDYWCDENKLQIQVDIMEANPDCSVCAHNTVVKYNDGSEKLYLAGVPECKFEFPKHRITKKEYIEPHISTKIFRTDAIDPKEVKNPLMLVYDIANNFYYLTKGKMYYIDKPMSVYNYTGTGFHSAKNPYQQRHKSADIIYQLNKEFDFKYNYLLSRFFATRLNLFITTYWKLKYFTPKNKLDKAYNRILTNFKKTYLSQTDIKPILRFVLPLSKKRRIVFELKREKDRV